MIRNFFARLLVLALAGICGYNTLKIESLEQQVAHLQRVVGTRRPDGAPVPSQKPPPAARTKRVDGAGQPPSADLIGEADRHIAQARAAIAKSDFHAAGKDVSDGLASLRQAIMQPANRDGVGLSGVQASLARLQREADDLWKKTHVLAPETQDENRNRDR